MNTWLGRRVSSHGLASHSGGAVCVCSLKLTCGTLLGSVQGHLWDLRSEFLTNKGLLSFTCLSAGNLVTTHFFSIVWYHLHPLSREYRRTLSSVGSIAWSLGQDTGTGAQILWALLPGISPTKCCFFSKQSGSSCRPARGQCRSLESRLPTLSPLALLSILMAITAPFLSFPVSKVTTSAKGAKKQRVWTDAVSCPPPSP